MTSRGESPDADPRALGSFHDDRPEIQALFERALAARLPRVRELKYWEPARLNERHLAMVMMRASGVNQRTIARAFNVTDANVSVVLNHPDAELLLAKLQSMRATQPSGIEARLAALTEPAMKSLEDAFAESEPEDLRNALKRAPLAFRVLEMNGHGKRPPVQEHEHKHRHELEASPEQMGALAAALRESRQIEDQPTIELADGVELGAVFSPGGGPQVSPPRVSPSGAAAPSSSGSQELSGASDGAS